MLDTSHPRGTIRRLTLASEALKGNLVGASPERAIDLYVPAAGAAGAPLLVDLVGYTGSGLSHTAWKAWGDNVPSRLDRLIATGAMPPVVVAFPDCFTRLGGNQYIDSAAQGRWATFLTAELVPAVEGALGCGGRGRRGVFGKSSGGYGAIVHAMLHADTWAAAACHSGDMAFDLCYLPDLPRALRELAARDGDVEKLVAEVHATQKPSPDLVGALMVLAMAATYDPDPSAPLGVRLPVTLDTCELIDERWHRWLAWDPLRMVDAHAAPLRSLRALYVDCGRRDQYNLLYGARRLHRALERLGVEHRYDEFDDDHTAVDYRMDESLPFLARALAAPA
ncbi:MAG TPA: alpha/beta hydrolase-fold protein [Kofleriaceae bacterium]|nr:alpha/beta hydrolase-fold protein [Kofleriaceae bacterium]